MHKGYRLWKAAVAHMEIIRLNFFRILLVEIKANTGPILYSFCEATRIDPSIGFCNLFLLGSKYDCTESYADR